jgi:hypothetical protein
MEKILILTALSSFVASFLIFSVYVLLVRKQEQELTQRMQKYSANLHPNLKFLDLSLTYVNDPKLRILTWTKSYRSWIEIVGYAQASISTVLLVAVLALVVNLICNNYLGITLL